ncbi:hypothetical protein CERZMDRAFT_86579 [Cercospora zeae-maydis SCOH1-5]|uniref:Uncharacterized protein n=1 Tax=Cercospora zeae-maydis SCOH1-5 TaxID=717836 RepID=A0A6A6F966_9PEZI|nr:hypothetical protein CERZMDRAFT_86579 [Cercospora zeae-maydis SCOH1-5]
MFSMPNCCSDWVARWSLQMASGVLQQALDRVMDRSRLAEFLSKHSIGESITPGSQRACSFSRRTNTKAHRRTVFINSAEQSVKYARTGVEVGARRIALVQYANELDDVAGRHLEQVPISPSRNTTRTGVGRPGRRATDNDRDGEAAPEQSRSVSMTEIEWAAVVLADMADMSKDGNRIGRPTPAATYNGREGWFCEMTSSGQ